jgi:hypothetical protein
VIPAWGSVLSQRCMGKASSMDAHPAANRCFLAVWMARSAALLASVFCGHAGEELVGMCFSSC